MREGEIMMENMRLFERDGDIIANLKKGEAYFSELANSTNDVMVMPKGDRLAKKISELSKGLQNGHKGEQKSYLATECLKELDIFRGSILDYQNRFSSNHYDTNRIALDEFHTAIVMYKIKHLP